MTKSACATPGGKVVPFPDRSAAAKPAGRDTRAGGVTSKIAEKPKEKLGSGAGVSRIPVPAVAPCHAGPARDEGGIEAFREREENATEAELRRRYKGEFETFRRILADHRAGKCALHPDWQNFKGFILGVGPMGPVEAARRTLDRIDNDDPEYGPGKGRWATAQEQANNRSTTRTLRGLDGTVRPLTEWARITGQKPNTMRVNLRRGWREEEVVAGKRGVLTAASGGSADDPWHDKGWPRGVTPAHWSKAYAAFRAMGRDRPDDEAPVSRELRPALTRAVLVAYVTRRRINRAHELTRENFPELENPDPQAPMPSAEALAAFPPYAALPRLEAALAEALAMIGEEPVQRRLLDMLHEPRRYTLAGLFGGTVGPFLPRPGRV